MNCHVYEIAERVLRCSEHVLVWSVARELEPRSISEFWEIRMRAAPGVKAGDSRAMAEAYRRYLDRTVGVDRASVRQCSWWHRVATLLGIPVDEIVFDEATRRTWIPARAGRNRHSLLVTRYEDAKAWRDIIHDVEPSFAPSDKRPRDKSADSGWLAFRELAVPIAREHRQYFNACDTVRFYGGV